MLASFQLTYHPGIPPAAAIAGSLILLYIGPPYSYHGSWVDGTDSFACDFQYNPTTATAKAVSAWYAGITGDMGNWTEENIILPPNILYRSAIITATSGRWTGRLTISS